MEISLWMVMIIVSTEGVQISSPRVQLHCIYYPPGTKLMGPFQTSSFSTKREPQG